MIYVEKARDELSKVEATKQLGNVGNQESIAEGIPLPSVM